MTNYTENIPRTEFAPLYTFAKRMEEILGINPSDSTRINPLLYEALIERLDSILLVVKHNEFDREQLTREAVYDLSLVKRVQEEIMWEQRKKDRKKD